jgi:hypothetical protein
VSDPREADRLVAAAVRLAFEALEGIEAITPMKNSGDTKAAAETRAEAAEATARIGGEVSAAAYVVVTRRRRWYRSRLASGVRSTSWSRPASMLDGVYPRRPFARLRRHRRGRVLTGRSSVARAARRRRLRRWRPVAEGAPVERDPGFSDPYGTPDQPQTLQGRRERPPTALVSARRAANAYHGSGTTVPPRAHAMRCSIAGGPSRRASAAGCLRGSAGCRCPRRPPRATGAGSRGGCGRSRSRHTESTGTS